MALPCSKRFRLNVTDVSTEGPFLKVTGQHSINIKAAILVERLLTKRTKELTSQKPVELEDVYVGMLCAAFYDHKFWRAKIIDIRNVVIDGKVDILFVDLGKKTTIKLCYLKHFDTDEDSRLIQMKPLANVYYLSRLISLEDEWHSGKLVVIESHLVNKVFTASIDMKTSFLPIVSLYTSVGDLTTYLVGLNLAFGVPLPFQLYNIELWASTCGQVASYEQLVEKSFIFNCMSHTERDPLHSPSICIPSETFGVPRSQLFELNSIHKVIVCNANASPEHFVVQLIHDEVDMSKMFIDINKVNHQPILQPLQIGSLCLARMSKCDYIICRAIVLNFSPTNCELYALDYGHTETVSYKDVFTISECFAQYPTFAHIFTLKEARKFKGNGVNNLLQELVAYKILNLKVVPTESHLRQSAKLYTQEGKDISKLLTIELENRQFTKINFTDQIRHQYSHRAVISHIKSCQNFYIHLFNMSDELAQIMQAVETHCRNSPPLSRVVVDMACCAKSCDGKWYRAKVLSVENNVVDVQFVDFGYDEKVEISNLRFITTELMMKWDMQAVHCALKLHQKRHILEICVQNLNELIPNKQSFIVTLSSDNSSKIIEVSLRRCNQRGQLAFDINKALNDMYISTKYVPDECDDTTIGATSSGNVDS